MKEVIRSFGMCGFYQKHVPSFDTIATPLTNLTHTNTTFKWMKQLKVCLIDTLILVKAQINQLFVLTIDAGNTHVGGILSQI